MSPAGASVTRLGGRARPALAFQAEMADRERRVAARMVASMLTIDAQVHPYERNHPGRPWIGHLVGPASATGDELVAAMDAVGVDGALMVSSFSL